MRLPSPAMIVACIALAVALSGASYAAIVLPKNSVGTKQLRPNAVKSSKIAPNQVTGDDVNEATLGQVSSAASAANAANAANADKLDGRDSSAFAPSASEPWHEIGAPGEPSFHQACTPEFDADVHWVPYGAGWNTPAFFRDPAGVVHLKGMIYDQCPLGTGSGNSGVYMFILPAGYRPAVTEVQVTIATGNTLNRVNISPTGEVSADIDLPKGFGNDGWISLDGVSFRAAG